MAPCVHSWFLRAHRYIYVHTHMHRQTDTCVYVQIYI
jgi:hypothetical protein